MQTETRYCSYCTDETTWQLPRDDDAPSSICTGCNKSADRF